MSAKSVTLKLCLAVLALTTTAGIASAQPGIAKSTVNVRSGPASSYSKVDSLYAGEAVEVLGCNGSWCKIEHDGPDGYVTQSYLKPAAPAAPGKPDLPFNLSLNFGPNGPQLAIGLGNQPPKPVTPPSTPNPNKVCFYTGYHYNGQSFCVAAGNNQPHLGGIWNDNIESVKIVGTGEYEICRDPNFGGGCIHFKSSNAALPPSYFNKVSSFQTW